MILDLSVSDYWGVPAEHSLERFVAHIYNVKWHFEGTYGLWPTFHPLVIFYIVCPITAHICLYILV